MTLEEVMAEKKRCEECVQEVLQRFEEHTGLSVREVKTEHVTFQPLDKAEEVRLTVVKLDVRL